MKRTKEENLLCQEMVNNIIKEADAELAHSGLVLPPGTYTAASISKWVKKTVYSSLCPILNWAHRGQQQVGMSGAKAHRWIIRDKREAVETIDFSIPLSKQQMKNLLKTFRADIKKKHAGFVLSLEDGCIRSVKIEQSIEENKPIVPNRIRLDGYSSPIHCRGLSFRIEASDMEHLYGECRLLIYRDDKGDTRSFLNPFNVRIAIETSDGWYVSSDEVVPLTDEYIQLYDSQFSDYDNDVAQEEFCPIVNEEVKAGVRVKADSTSEDDNAPESPGNNTGSIEMMTQTPDAPDAVSPECAIPSGDTLDKLRTPPISDKPLKPMTYNTTRGIGVSIPLHRRPPVLIPRREAEERKTIN